MKILPELRRRVRRAPKMSVVVPVYNPGEYFGPCVDSLLHQSLPSSQYEVVFVDDGSTDGTEKRLDELAQAHRNVRAIHLPNSGWPGRPRNVGLEAARGEYVYFVDHDDSLAPEALERVYAMASRNGADVIIGRIEGHGRRVPETLFDETHERCTVATAPLMESMTPHKAFRRAFLEEHGLRFPEGRRRLEDHVFVVEAYLRAKVVSVLADYTCYHHIRREDGGNAAYGTLDPEAYFGNLREGIRIVEELTEPGPLRDRVLRRWYSVEMLGRVGGRTFLDYPPDYRRSMVGTVRELALEHFTSPGIWEELEPHLVLRSALLRRGDVEALERLAEFESSLVMDVHTERLGPLDGGFAVEAVALVRTDAGQPGLLTGEDGSLRLGAAGCDVVAEDRSAHRRLPRARVVLRHRETREHRFVLASVDVVGPAEEDATGPLAGHAGARLRVTATVDPEQAGGAPLGEGTWDLFLRVDRGLVGRTLTARLAGEASAAEREAAAGRAELYETAAGNASIRVRRP